MEAEKDRQAMELELREIRERRSALTALIEQSLQTDSMKQQESAPINDLHGHPKFGEIIAVEPGYEKAVEVVLSTFLPAITVSNFEFKNSSVEELQQSDAVLVAPSTEFESGSKLADVITQGREYVPQLCSEVFVDDSLEAALARQKYLKPHESTVTRTGIWVGKNWIRFNGSTRDKRTLLENRKELIELNEHHDKKAREHQAKLQKVTARSQRRTELREMLRTVRQQQSEVNSQLTEINARIDQHKLEHYQASVRSANAEQERESIKERKLELEQDLSSQDSYISKLNAETTKLDKTRKHLQDKEKENGLASAQALQEDRAAQAEHHRLDLECNNLQAQITSCTLSSELLTKSLVDLKQRVQLLDEQIQTDEESVHELEAQLTDAVKQAATVDQELATVRAERDSILHQIRENNVAESQQQILVDKRQQAAQKLREEHIQVTSKLEFLVSELSALDVQLEEAKDSLDSDDNEESLTRVLDRTERRIEKLGAVNLAAAQDLDARKSEYDTYQSRIHDLETSQDTLRQAMQKIDKETLVLFNEAFTNTNEKFQKVFTRLFGGGRAELVMTDDDPLTAGVSMRLQPPGKQIKNLSQLSAGEKALAALAFTFAMFELNPSPICILDEVDAPLDAHNVSRFGKLIHSMANDVQFLIITHSRGTMNFAESLIGITMQEAGVSRVVSVDLE